MAWIVAVLVGHFGGQMLDITVPDKVGTGWLFVAFIAGAIMAIYHREKAGGN